MGTKFKLISDDATKYCKAGDVGEVTCHRCNREDLDVYRYSGLEFINGEENEYDELCEECIKSSNVILNYPKEWKCTIQLCKDKDAALQELSACPRLPCFIQGYDAPVCCGSICEFIGIPTDKSIRKHIPKLFKFWEKGFVKYSEIYDCSPETEFLEDIGFFRCRSCQKEIFTFQFM